MREKDHFMYRCMITGKNSQLGEPCNRITVKQREKTYLGWRKNEETREYEEVVVGQGYEIVKEIVACAEGVSLWNSWNETDRSLFLKTIGIK